MDIEARYAALYILALESAEKSDEERLTRQKKEANDDDGESMIGIYIFVAVAILVVVIVLAVIFCFHQKRKNEK